MPAIGNNPYNQLNNLSQKQKVILNIEDLSHTGSQNSGTWTVIIKYNNVTYTAQGNTQIAAKNAVAILALKDLGYT